MGSRSPVRMSRAPSRRVRLLILQAKAAVAGASARVTRLALSAVAIVALGFTLGGPLDALVNPSTVSGAGAASRFAGRSMQGVAAIAGLVGCSLAAGSARKGTSGGRAEMLLASGYPPELPAVFSALASCAYLWAIGLVCVPCFYLAAPVGLPELVGALVLVYVPTTLFAACVGASLAPILRSGSAPVAAYGVWWVLSILWSIGLLGGVTGTGRVPESLATVTVTGESLNLALFEPPFEIRSPYDPSLGIPRAVWESMAGHDAAVRAAASLNLPFLLCASVISLVACYVALGVCRVGGVSGGPGSRARAPILSQGRATALIRTIGLARPLRATLALALVLSPLVLLSNSPSRGASVMACSVLPLALGLALVGTGDAELPDRAGAFVALSPKYPQVRLFRCLATEAFCALVLLAASGWWALMGVGSPCDLFLDGLVPTMLFPALAVASEGSWGQGRLAPRLALFATWAALQAPAGIGLLASLGLADLHPMRHVFQQGAGLSARGYALWSCLILGLIAIRVAFDMARQGGYKYVPH